MSAPHMPMMNDQQLLECPFCSELDEVFIWRKGNTSRAFCSACGAEGGASLTDLGARSRWNTRNGHLYTKADFAEKSWEMQNSDLTGGV